VRDGQLERPARRQREPEADAHRREQGRVDQHARPRVARAPLAFERDLRRQPDQVRRALELGHHAVARVDALRTGDALHLQPVADVDARRARGHAQPAVDAVAARRAALAARLAAARVVGDHERVGVEHHALEASVGAQVLAERLPHQAEVEVGQRARRAEEAELHAAGLALRELAQELERRREVREQVEADHERHGDPDAVRDDDAQLRDVLRRARALPALNAPRDAREEIGEHRLRTCPAAPHAAGDRGHEEQRQREPDRDQPQQEQLLREDHAPEHVEAAARDVEAQQRLAADLEPGQHEQPGDQQRVGRACAGCGRSRAPGGRRACPRPQGAGGGGGGT
jgi:hypothetical protein